MGGGCGRVWCVGGCGCRYVRGVGGVGMWEGMGVWEGGW